jgi:hypothetical protein
MITIKSHRIQRTMAVMTLILVLAALSMIWPTIIAISFGIFLLLQSFAVEQEHVILSWSDIDKVSIACVSFKSGCSATC